MTSPSDSNTPKLPAWLGALIPLLIILLVAGLFWYLIDKPDDSIDPDTNPGISISGKLKPGQTYYVFASEIEVFPSNLKNESWDRGKNAPDIRYQLLWKGNSIFESITKDDSLIADWSGLSVELNWKDILGKSVSPDDAIKAARIRYEKNERVEIVVEDVDISSDDDIGRYEIEMDSLSVGKNEIKLTKSSTNAIRKITLRLLPMGSNLKDLVNIMK